MSTNHVMLTHTVEKVELHYGNRQDSTRNEISKGAMTDKHKKRTNDVKLLPELVLDGYMYYTLPH